MTLMPSSSSSLLTGPPYPGPRRAPVDPTSVREEGDRRGEAVKKRSVAARSDLAGARHPRERRAPERVRDPRRVVVRYAEQVGAAAVAGEHEPPRGGAPRHELTE